MCGIHIIQEEEPAWFPTEDLKEFYGIVPHKVRSFKDVILKN